MLEVAFATELLKVITGHVSVDVDPRNAFDHKALGKNARYIMALFEERGVSRNRYNFSQNLYCDCCSVLVRLPATAEGFKVSLLSCCLYDLYSGSS